MEVALSLDESPGLGPVLTFGVAAKRSLSGRR